MTLFKSDRHALGRSYGYKELYMTPNRDALNIPGMQLIAAHAMQCLVCADFAYYYIKVRRKRDPAALADSLLMGS